MARILIVDDKTFFSGALATILKAEGHAFAYANNSKAAREFLEREDFDGVICDAMMASFSGLDFALWLRRNKPTPLILMAGFSDQVDAKAPYGMSGVTLLVKPFNRENVRAALIATVPANRLSADGSLQVEALVPVPKAGIRKTGSAEFSFFHYVDGHPRKLLSRGDDLAQFIPPNGARLYTDRESLTAVLTKSIGAAQGAAANKKIDATKRAALMQDTLQIVNEQMSSMSIDQASAEAALEMLSVYFKSIGDGAVWDMISSLDTFSRPIYTQTLAVTMVCLVIAHEYQFSTEDCFKLTTAALFHDVGYTSLDPVLIKTPRPLLAMKDRTLLEKHVEIGVAILQKSGWVSSEVCGIVWQHHESMVGNGFPRGLKGPDIHPLARLLHLADDFCLSIMKTGGQPGIPPVKAAELLKDRRELDQKLVVSLHRIIQRGRVKQTST